jgi:phage FluMu protein Com
MPDIRFRCVNCGAKLVIDGQGAGCLIACPHCHAQNEVPTTETAPSHGALLTPEEIEMLTAPSPDTPAPPPPNGSANVPAS